MAGPTPKLKSRKPTGKIPWPTVMIAGPEKSGKTETAYRMALSPHVAGAYVIDLGEGVADAMLHVTGPDRYEILEHDGTFASIEEQVHAACAQRSPDGRPYVVILDNGTDLWEGLRDNVDRQARATAQAQRILAADPDAEIKAGFDRWNAGKGRWGKLIGHMRLNPVIGVVIVRADVVTLVQDGSPVLDPRTRKPMKTVSYRCEKSFPNVATMIVETGRDDDGFHARLVGAWAPGLTIPTGGLVLDTSTPDRNPLDEAFFGFILGSGERAAGQAQFTAMQVGMTVGAAKTWLVGQVAGRLGVDTEAAKLRAARMWQVWAAAEYRSAYEAEHPNADPAEVAAAATRATTAKTGTPGAFPGETLTDALVDSLTAYTLADLGETDPLDAARPLAPEPTPEPAAAPGTLAEQSDSVAPRFCPECGEPHHLGTCSRGEPVHGGSPGRIVPTSEARAVHDARRAAAAVAAGTEPADDVPDDPGEQAHVEAAAALRPQVGARARRDTRVGSLLDALPSGQAADDMLSRAEMADLAAEAAAPNQ